jgi:glycosyltransferase involved in cell wall biosynthesis
MLSGEFSLLVPFPQVLSVMDVNYMIYPDKWDWLWRLYSRLSLKMASVFKVGRLITISEYSKYNLIKYFKFPPDKISVIYPGISSPKDNGKVKEGLGTYVLYVGAIEPHKNLALLVRAFSQLLSNSKFMELNLVILGKHSRGVKQLKYLVNQLMIKQKVIFTGVVDDDGLGEYYRNASLFVFPSLIEGFGFPPLEAMIRGIPVVASDIPCHREVLGDSVVYFDPFDVSSLKDAITSVLSNASLRQSLILRGIERAKEYTWERCAKMTAEVYRQLARESLFVEPASNLGS